MRAPQFTSGPWKAKTSRVITAPYHRVCANGQEMDYHREVAWTQPVGDWGDREANAHLIAAAPNLYQTLEKIRSAASALSHPALCIIDSLAADALAKARGEQ